MRMLVSTLDKPGGWGFSITIDYHSKTVELSISRTASGSTRTWEQHPMSGKVWSYAKALDEEAAVAAIRATCDKIGLEAGALAWYERTGVVSR